MKKELFEILEIYKKDNEYFSVLLKDNNNNIDFWLDCVILKDNDGEYIEWEFNQYIFHLDNENDVKRKNYQENEENIENIIYFMDEKQYNLIEEVAKC